jgi:hypothetical protein
VAGRTFAVALTGVLVAAVVGVPALVASTLAQAVPEGVLGTQIAVAGIWAGAGAIARAVTDTSVCCAAGSSVRVVFPVVLAYTNAIDTMSMWDTLVTVLCPWTSLAPNTVAVAWSDVLITMFAIPVLLADTLPRQGIELGMRAIAVNTVSCRWSSTGCTFPAAGSLIDCTVFTGPVVVAHAAALVVAVGVWTALKTVAGCWPSACGGWIGLSRTYWKTGADIVIAVTSVPVSEAGTGSSGPSCVAHTGSAVCRGWAGTGVTAAGASIKVRTALPAIPCFTVTGAINIIQR